MKIAKYYLSVLLLLFVSLSMVFATGGGGESSGIKGTTDAVLIMYPRSCTYDKANAIDLKDAKSLSSIGNSPLTFSADSENHLSILRFSDTLHNMFTWLPTVNGHTYNDYTNVSGKNYSEYEDGNKMFQTDNSVTLIIQTTGFFSYDGNYQTVNGSSQYVSDPDPSETRDFSLTCILNEAYYESSGSYTLGVTNQTLTSEDRTLSDTVSKTRFKDLGNGTYELTIPSSPLVSNSSKYYPLFQRLFDVCIKLNSSATLSKNGFYKTEIVVYSTDTYVNRLFEGTSSSQNGTTYINTTQVPMQMHETITVWGYYGDVQNPATTTEYTYSFSVVPSTDTYSMILDTYTGSGDNKEFTTYSVAKVDFYTFSQSSAQNSLPSRSTKYRVYISPSNSYTSTSSSYAFQRTKGSGSIAYDLYLEKRDGTYIALSSPNIVGPGSDQLDTFYSSSMVFGGASNDGAIYCIYPKYTVSSEHYQVTENRVTVDKYNYTETWNLTNVYINLRVDKNDSLNHDFGQYVSNLYFFLVTE